MAEENPEKGTKTCSVAKANYFYNFHQLAARKAKIA